jgi:hypothetical protein
VSPAWSIEGTAIRLGGYAWVEQRLFEVLGGLVRTGGSPRVAMVALAHASHHAWHAELWRARIPILAHLAVGSLVVPPSAEVADALEGPGESSMVYRVVLPGLVEVYARHLDRARPVADGPVIRALELVLADERRDLSEGQALLGPCDETPAALEWD